MTPDSALRRHPRVSSFEPPADLVRPRRVGIVGTEGVIDIEDTHRDVILATENAQGPAYNPDGLTIEVERNVDFLTSFPPGDMHDGELWGPMREETQSWFNRIYNGKKTPHATAAEGHRNLVLTMAMDLSAKQGKELKLPIDPAELIDRKSVV